jgi:hypothetical protein
LVAMTGLMLVERWAEMKAALKVAYLDSYLAAAMAA